MHDILVTLNAFGLFQVEITGWKLVGFTGVLLFGARWLVQAVVSHYNGRPMLPRTFWYMSLVGALLSLSYFIFGKNDSVGILGFLFPSVVAIYNLMLDSSHKKKTLAADLAADLAEADSKQRAAADARVRSEEPKAEPVATV